MVERVDRRTFLYMSVVAAAGALASACDPQSKSVEISAIATATEIPSRVPPEPTVAESPEDRATRVAESKMNMWPELEWDDPAQENNFLHIKNPNRETVQDQVIALRGCVDSWAREGIIDVDEKRTVAGLKLVAFEKKEGVVLGLKVVGENNQYGEGTLLFALDLGKSVSQNTLVSVGGEEVLAGGCQVKPTLVTANVSGLLGPQFSASEIVWDSQRNTLVAKDKDGQVIAFVNPQYQTEGKSWDLVLPTAIQLQQQTLLNLQNAQRIQWDTLRQQEIMRLQQQLLLNLQNAQRIQQDALRQQEIMRLQQQIKQNLQIPGIKLPPVHQPPVNNPPPVFHPPRMP